MKQKPKQIKNKTQETEKDTEKKRNSGDSTPKRYGAERPQKTSEKVSNQTVKEQVEESEAASKNQNTLKMPEELNKPEENIDVH